METKSIAKTLGPPVFELPFIYKGQTLVARTFNLGTGYILLAFREDALFELEPVCISHENSFDLAINKAREGESIRALTEDVIGIWGGQLC